MQQRHVGADARPLAHDETARVRYPEPTADLGPRVEVRAGEKEVDAPQDLGRSFESPRPQPVGETEQEDRQRTRTSDRALDRAPEGRTSRMRAAIGEQARDVAPETLRFVAHQ
jgi:hypothetical protein